MITIDEAIETLGTYLKGEEAVEHDKLIASMELGLEALEVILKERRDLVSYAGELLPGETEEG